MKLVKKWKKDLREEDRSNNQSEEDVHLIAEHFRSTTDEVEEALISGDVIETYNAWFYLRSFIAIFFSTILLFSSTASATKIGLVSDLHVGKEKVRINGNGSKVYPKLALSKFKSTLQIMNNDNVDFVLVLGDNTNRNESKYAKKTRRASIKSQSPVLFVKGNHDKSAFKYYNTPNYYIRDVGDTTIMVLDTNYTDINSLGEISPSQRQWIEQSIDGVDIIAMHHPILDINLNIIPRYQWLASLIEKHEIKAVYSGHYHSVWNSGVYHGVGALTNHGYIITNL